MLLSEITTNGSIAIVEAQGRSLPERIVDHPAVTGQQLPVGVAVEFSCKQPLTTRPAPWRSHAAAGYSANSPQPHDLAPAANGGMHSVPPTLIPNAATRGTGASMEVGRRARDNA